MKITKQIIDFIFDENFVPYDIKEILATKNYINFNIFNNIISKWYDEINKDYIFDFNLMIYLQKIHKINFNFDTDYKNSCYSTFNKNQRLIKFNVDSEKINYQLYKYRIVTNDFYKIKGEKIEFSNFVNEIFYPGNKYSKLIQKNNIKEIVFGKKYNQPFFTNFFNSNIKSISFGYSFNQKFEQNILPNDLTHLILGNNFNHELVNIPKSLTHLTLGKRFNKKINFSNFPNLVKLFIPKTYYFLDEVKNYKITNII